MAITEVRLSVQIKSGNDALVTDPAEEISKILRKVITDLETLPISPTSDDYHVIQISDTNGNRIGAWALVTETDGDDE